MRFCSRRLLLILGGIIGLQLVPGCDAGDRTRPPSADSITPGSAAAWFQDITVESGIEFSHKIERDRRYFFPEIMAPGAAFFDYDLDGDLDVYVVNGATEELDTPVEFRSSTNRLFQNAGGRFIDVTEGSGLDDAGYGMGAAVGDVNNDGYPDLYVTNYGPDKLFLNHGGETFVDVTHAVGIDNSRWSASACFVDFDRDGWLDLFVTNYVDYHPFHPCRDAAGRLDYCNPAEFQGTSDVLYHNRSARSANAKDEQEEGPVEGGQPNSVAFEDVSLRAGIAGTMGAGLGVVAVDFNGDAWPDIYVANDEDANSLWINRQDGTFRDEAVLNGVAYDTLGRAQAGMGIAVGDIDDDGLFDLLVTHLHGETNALYLSAHGPPFLESSASAGVAAASFPYTGFGVALVDFENDGDLDLAVVNGRVRRRSRQLNDSANVGTTSFHREYAESNQLFLNDGRGNFKPLPDSTNSFSSQYQVSRALVYGDVDNDGDIDFFVTNSGGPAQLFRNDSPDRGHWVNVRPIEPLHGGRDAYGAVVTVYAESKRWRQYMNPGSSYLASNDPRLHFGIGDTPAVQRIEVLWPDGSLEVFRDVPIDSFSVLAHGTGAAE